MERSSSMLSCDSPEELIIFKGLKKERRVAALSNRLLSVSKIVAFALEVFR